MDSSDDEQVTIVKSKKKITLLDSDDEGPNGSSDQKRPVLKDSSDSDGEVTKNSKKSNAAFAESNSDSDNSLNESRSKSVKKSKKKRAAFAESDSDSDVESKDKDLNKSQSILNQSALNNKGLYESEGSSDEGIDKVAASRGSSRSNSDSEVRYLHFKKLDGGRCGF